MKTILNYLIPLLSLFACTSNQEKEITTNPTNSDVQTIQLNTNSGYTINIITGDTIQPLINSLGDTLVTGSPILLNGEIINPDSVSKPITVKASNPKVLPTHLNRIKIPENLTVIPVKQDSLITVKIGETGSDKNFILLNGQGDTITTAKPIIAKEKKTSLKQPKKINTLLPRTKDNSIYDIQYLSLDQGLPNSYIWSMMIDQNDNIWFGTWSAGLCKYDGKTITQYTKKNGLNIESINCILEDRNGNIWIGGPEGLSLFDGTSFTNYTTKEGLSHDRIKSIIEDRDGNIWIGSFGGGLSKFDGTYFTHFTTKEGLSGNYIRSLCEDENGNIWIGTNSNGVNKFDGVSFTYFTTKEGLIHNSVSSIYEDNNSNIWFGTNGGVNKFNGSSFTHFTTKEGLSHNRVMSIIEDKNGGLWFSTYGGGINKFNGKEFVHYKAEHGLTNNKIFCSLIDQVGNIWIGTYSGGVCKINPSSFTHLTKEEGLLQEVIITALEDQNNDLWFGTQGGGICRYNGESFAHYTTNEGLSNNDVRFALEDKKGNLWFATNGGGISKFDGTLFTYYTKKEGLSSNYIATLLEDKKGNLWIGTNGGGLNKFDGKSFTHYTTNQGFIDNSVTSILEDKNGTLWLGTNHSGLVSYDGARFTNFTEKEGLSSNNILCLHEDEVGNIWIGTGDAGIIKYNDSKFTFYTEKEGLSNNRVYSIQSTKNGNLWATTEKGINRLVYISESSGNESIKIENFFSNDGLKALDFYYQSSLIDSENKIWWGSSKSLVTLDLNTFNTAKKSPPVYLKQIDINDQFVDYNNDSLNNNLRFDQTQQFENYPLNPELSYHQNHLTFHFSAIDWSAPHKINYSYLLEGLNSKWSQPSSEGKADYSNLPYGTYTFKAKAIGESNEWSIPFEYPFVISPPWWHTWWARTLYTLAISFMIVLVVKWRTANLKKRQKELETEVEIATKEIRDQKKEVEQQKEIIEEVHKEITDSLIYAERIQRSFMATKELLDKNLNDYFVFFQPKDVVSGDFYWAAKLNDGNFAIVNADSTGHGVPGAIMSILNISSIEASIKNKLTTPAAIFNDTRNTIIDRLKKDGSPEGGKDGMDATLITLNTAKNKMTYVAAQNPIWIIRDGGLIEIKPEKMPVGKHEKDQVPFKGGEYDIKKGDQIYTLTDGFQDQFGGPKGKKFMVKKMRTYILSISHLSMEEQHGKMKEVFTNWKGGMEQVDDVCIIGVKI